MQYDWILDVLDDLRAFAKGNGLSVLAEQLEDTSLVAAAEIATVSLGVIGGGSVDADPDGAFRRSAAPSEHA
jgi:hypothetical protein